MIVTYQIAVNNAMKNTMEMECANLLLLQALINVLAFTIVDDDSIHPFIYELKLE